MHAHTRLLVISMLFAALTGCDTSHRVTQDTSKAVSPSPATPTDTLPPSSSVSATDTPRACPVTFPDGSTPPGEQVPGNYYSTGMLWVGLWPEGKVLARPEQVSSDGSVTMKFPWWRGIRGQLIIEGRRLDGPAPSLQARIPDGYGEIGFQSTLLVFPRQGCWEVTGRVGSATLTFVTSVASI